MIPWCYSFPGSKMTQKRNALNHLPNLDCSIKDCPISLKTWLNIVNAEDLRGSVILGLVSERAPAIPTCPCVNLSVSYTQWFISNEKNKTKVIGWHFWDYITNGWLHLARILSVSLWFSCMLVPWSKLSGCKLPLEEAHMENWGIPLTNNYKTLKLLSQ